MNFTEIRQDQKGTYEHVTVFAESDDLIHWTRLDQKYDFHPDPRWYEPDGRWDNVWPVPKAGGGYYGYFQAMRKNKIAWIGLGESLDGITWRALEPPLFPEVPTTLLDLEVGAVHLWRDRYYALLGLNGTRPGESFELEVFRPCESTFISDSPFGPFLLAKKNPRLLVGNASYFTRFVDTPGGVLVNHHSWELDPGQPWSMDVEHVYMAPLKKAEWDDEGTLRLMWWEQNSLAKGDALQVSSEMSPTDSRPALLETPFDPNKTLILEGVMSLPDSKEAAPAGLYLQGTGNAGTAFLARENGAVAYGSMRPDGTHFAKLGDVDRDLLLKGSATFRLVRKGRLTEFYLNDYLMQCYSLPEQGTGRIGLIGHAHKFRELRAWYCH